VGVEGGWCSVRARGCRGSGSQPVPCTHHPPPPPLQKLARHWKLHHRRGFWRDHPTVSDLARALYNHHITLGNKDARSRALRGTLSKGGPESKEGDVEEGGAPGTPTLAPVRTGPLFKYRGDKFGTQGDYMDGTLYLSRITQPGQPKGPLAARAAAEAAASESGVCSGVG
jgi:hypothetical protein